ncbi:unnamed protein product [Rhizophagus irregularis]|nr:unnamed protein product [Rhizophagus irregularis]CAB5375914.1 unnamed protein product [Rhizophagus irregularis]
MSSTSSTQTVRRSKRLQDKKNSSLEQPIGKASGILQKTQITATVVIEQLPPDAAMASTKTTQQTPHPKRGRKRKNSSPERPIETESENHQIQDTNAQETTTSIIEQPPSVTQTVRRSKRLRNLKNSSSEQQLGTEFETLQIQGKTARVTTKVIEQLLPDAAMANTSSDQQNPLPKRERKRNNPSPEQLVGTESENQGIATRGTSNTMDNTSSTQTVRRSKRIRNQKNSSPEQQIGTEFETLQIQGTTARVTPTITEQLLSDAAMASTSSDQQTPLPKRGRKRKNSSPEQLVGTVSETLQLLLPDTTMPSTSSTQTVRSSKRLRNQKNASPEQPVETEVETPQIQELATQGTTVTQKTVTQETTTRATAPTIIEQLPPDAAMANTSSTQQISSHEQSVGNEYETLQIQETTTQETTTRATTPTVIEQLPPDVAMANTSSTERISSHEQPVGSEYETLQIQETTTQKTTTRATTPTVIEQLPPDAAMANTSSTEQISSHEQPVGNEYETLQIQETTTQETATRAITSTVIEQLPPVAVMDSTSFTQQISSHEQSVGTESETLQIQETTTQDITTLEVATQVITTRMATPTVIEQLPPTAAMASMSSTQQISSYEQPVGTEYEILQIQETITQGTTVTQETAARVTSTTIEQLLPYAAMPSTSFEETSIQEITTQVTTLTVIERLPPDVVMASTSSTQQREQSVGTESETPGRETSLNEQPAGTGPVEVPSIGGATNENNNEEREARPAKKKKKSRKSKAEKRLARFKTCCSLRYRERMIRAEQQRIYLIERNKITDLREKFVIVGPTGNVYTVTIAHLPDCTCPDFMKGFICKHIFFVYLKVLGVNRDSTLIYQKALLSKELRSIFTNARPSPTVMALRKIRDRYKKFTSSNVNENENEKRRPIEGNCPICYDSLEEKDRDKIVWCRQGCGNNLHKDCFEQWKRSRYGGRVTCVYCRVNWVEPEVYITNDGYINLGNVQRSGSIQRLNILQGAAYYRNFRTII